MNGENRTALVTGAGMGIGKAIALALAMDGCDVAIHCNGSVERAGAVCREIRAMGRNCEVFRRDLSAPEEIDGLFRDVRERFGRLDVLVANAGITVKGRIEDMQWEEIDKVYSVNFRGTYLCIQKAAALMRECSARGSIVVISSNNYRMHHPLCSAYGSLKCGLNKLADKGELLKVSMPGTADRFDFRTDDHIHIYCKSCGKVFDAEIENSGALMAAMNEMINDSHDEKLEGFGISKLHISLEGICPECKKVKGES